MTRVALAALLAVASLTVAPPPQAAAQEPDASSRVTMPQSAGPPGGSVAVPVQIAAADGVRIGSLTLSLRFAPGQLTFDRVEIGGLGEAVGATAATKTAGGADEAIVEITIGTPEKDGARAALPDGPIAQLMFTVASGAQAETAIPIRAEASARSTAGAPVEIAVAGGEIVVSNPSVVGCFFYMH